MSPTVLAPEFTHPHLVGIYDIVCAYDEGTQPEFYGALAAERGAELVLDLGCGTGLITCALARSGRRVVGVDPSPAMIAVARRARLCSGVRWIVGSAGAVGPLNADLAIMTGHVAQFFLTDDDWRAALASLQAALRPGGTLAFETRNPLVRSWERWTGDTRRTVTHPTEGPIDFWTVLVEEGDGIVLCEDNYLFTATGEHLISPVALRFRALDEIAASLDAAGFAIDEVYGDWDRRLAGPGEKEIIVVARS